MTEPRATGADRTQILDRLNRALEQGHLTTADYDARVAAAVAATYVTELRHQVRGLPAELRWDPPAAAHRPGVATSAKSVLALGIISVPLSFCLIGGLIGVLAVVLSRRAARGDRAALIGRVLGIVSIALSGTALVALVTLLNGTTSP